jgi:hypothetical protein
MRTGRTRIATAVGDTDYNTSGDAKAVAEFAGSYDLRNTLADCSTRKGGTTGFEQEGTEETPARRGYLCILRFKIRIIWQQVLVLVEVAAGRSAGEYG